ncbi:MAG: neutral zinc metallopeptidase [Gemmataceae bacterium]|nr:neutral zinc metallopeptidase [Gemmataceae bacterium]MDW8266778.1 neutral zinc metallopeptidase [Gemmataceae bacterium]
MYWEGREETSHVEDRRSFGSGTGVAVGGGSVIVLLLALLLGGDPQRLIQFWQAHGPAPAARTSRRPDPAEQRLASFTKVIFRDTEIIWEEQFRRLGRQYLKPTLVLFSGHVSSACGSADAAVGPFYCPGDHRVYIDLSFYRDMERQLHAPGEFARAYVIAHEVGHHVQTLLGYTRQVDEARRRLGRHHPEINRLSVRLELQADFLAGVWAHHGQKKFRFLEPGDVESALNAAFQIGDDRLQKRARGYVVPDSFTHGTSRQRQRWFLEGFQTGDVRRAALLFELPYDQL